jgi:hypothetical protein
MDSLPAFGPASTLSIEVDSEGVAGAVSSVRPAEMMDTKVQRKSQDQIDREFELELANEQGLSKGGARLISKRMCYWDENRQYVQPVWLYNVEIFQAKGDKSAVEIVIPIAKNMPEPLLRGNFDGFKPIMPEIENRDGANGQVTTIKLGEYVVREDSDPGICLNVVNAFYNNSHFIAPFVGHGVNRTQYYWNHPWLWNDALGIPDNCRFYPGATDFAVVVAHASPWRFTCLSNYGESVDLHNFDHFGANLPSGNPDNCKTSYMLFAACSLIPAPGDPYGGAYTSGSPWDVWWNVFWGMHGVYGFRTTAGKQSCVDAFGNFGIAAGVGHPNLSAWLNTTSSLNHGSNWNYGAIVLPSGSENDNMYNTTARAKASSLTIWWNHA